MKGNIHGGKLKAAERVCVGVYITKDTHEKLLAIAHDSELTISDVVRSAIKEHIATKQNDKKE